VSMTCTSREIWGHKFLLSYTSGIYFICACGSKLERPEKTHDFQQSVGRLFSHESVAKLNRTDYLIGERRLLWQLCHRSPTCTVCTTVLQDNVFVSQIALTW
jgi:hypothetical protein